MLCYLTAPPLFGHETRHSLCCPLTEVVSPLHYGYSMQPVSFSLPPAWTSSGGDVSIFSNLSAGWQPNVCPAGEDIVATISCTDDGPSGSDHVFPPFEPGK